MIKTIAIVAALAVAALLIYAASRPDTFSVQRTASIKAPAERVYPMINDLHQFNTWNPFEKDDPSVRGQYRGPLAGPGAAYDFQGGKSGKGSISVVESASPTKIMMKLDMLEPLEGHNIVEFTIAPQGGATQVTWAMHGRSSFVAKLAGVFMNMDRMVGGKFEDGLANLKAKAETAA